MGDGQGMPVTRAGKMRCIGRYLLRHVGLNDILAALPYSLLSVGFLTAWLCVPDSPRLAVRLEFLTYWPAYELVSVLVFQYMLFIFDKDPRLEQTTPAWLRAAAVLLIPLFMFGLKASFMIFKKLLFYFWPFIAVKVITLFLRPPTEKDRSVGCLGALLGLLVLLPFCLAWWSAPANSASTLHLFMGCPYFAVLAVFEVFAEPLWSLPDYAYWDTHEE